MGFDILLDKDYKAWILEINDHPSMNVYGDHQEAAEGEGINIEPEITKVISQTDLHVKSRVMLDCLKLALMTPEERSQIGEDYNSLTKILPCSDE